MVNVAFNNTGTVEVDTGTLTFNGVGTGTGNYNVLAGADVTFGNNASGNVFAGAGTYTVSGGTVIVNNSLQNAVLTGGVLTVFGSITNLTWSGGTLEGTVLDAGSITWTGGALLYGSCLTVASNAVLNLSGNSTLNLFGVLTNAGTVNWTGTGNLSVVNGNGYTGGIVNLAGAVFNAQNDQTILNGYSGYFNNAGSFVKSPTTGTTTINVAFNNTGIVNVQSGTVAMQGQFTGTGGGLSFALNGATSYGSMSFASPLALASAGTLQAHTANGYSPRPGDGFPLLSYPSATGNFTDFNLPPQTQWQTVYDPTAFIIVAVSSQPITNAYTWTGTVSSDWSNPNNWNPVGVPDGSLGQAITFSNGTINVSTPITINGLFNWLGGALTGNPLTIATNGALSIGGGNVKILQTALTNSGTAIWGGGNLVLSNCAAEVGSVVNASNGFWDIWCDQIISLSCANTNSYWANAGTVLKSYSAGTTTVGVPFYSNSGSIGLLQGAVAFNEPVVFNTGSLSGNGAVIFNDGVQNNQALSVNGITLTLGGAWANTQTVNATNAVINLGGTFSLSTYGIFNTAGITEYLTGTFKNTGTALLLGSSVGSWIMNGGSIEGGIVTTTNGTSLLVGSSGGTLNGVTLNGTLDVGDSIYSGSGVVLTVQNGLTLNGTALVGNPTNSNFGALNFVGSQTLGGNASVLFGEAPSSGYNALRLANAGSTLTIASGITIEGQNGTIGYSSAYGGSPRVSVINNGTISGNVTPGTITVAAQGYTQQGILSVASGNVVNVQGSIFLTGLGLFSIQSGGTIQVAGNLSGSTVNAGGFSALGTLILNGSGTGAAPQFFEVMGRDFGISPVGFIHNFTYGTIILANHTYVRLIDQYHNSSGTGSEALYVNSLVVPAGTTLDLNGLHLYARALQLGGTVVNGTVSQVPNSGPIGFGDQSLGNLAGVGQLDQWTFFARAGQYYTVLVDPGSDIGVSPALGNVQVQVLNTNGQVIATAVNSPGGAEILLSSIAVTNDGTYSVQIHAPPAFPSSTGHYLVTVWQTTPNVGSVVLNQIVTGDIQSPYSVDQWNFAASAGDQIRFHLVNVSGSGIGFDLSGPGGPLGFTNLTTDSSFITLPTSGNYSITAHSLNGQYGVVYAFELLETVQTNLILGTAYQGQWAGNGQAALFQFNLPAGSPMQIVLNNLAANNHANIYVGYGKPPTPSSYTYSSTTPSTPNQSVLIPFATAGNWYVLVYGDNIQTPGGFTIQASASSILLSSCTPATTGVNAPSTLTLRGAGFDGTTSVQFIDAANNVYQATSVSVDSFTQLTVTEAAGALPPGLYSISATLGSGASGTLPNSFQLLSNAAPNLVTSLTLPNSIGYHIPATIYPEYCNNGDASMPAPLLVLTAYQYPTGGPLSPQTGNGTPSASQTENQGAFLTLDSTLVKQGLWTSAEPAGFSHSVQFLGSGQTPGILQAGECDQTPIFYAGWQQPWDFSYPPVYWHLGVIQASDPTPVDWSSVESSMQPSTIPADAWDAIFSVFSNQAGTTLGGYVSMLDNDASYLGRLGLNVSDIGKLLTFQFMQADALNPLYTLASSVDASIPTPGLPLTFSRTFGERISQRYALGAFGRGWSHNWQYSLSQGSDGTVTILGPGGSQRVFQPNTQSGGYWAQTGDYGTLASAGGGAFRLTEKSGLAYYYAANGTLSYLQDLNGNTITLGYTGGLLTSVNHSSGQRIQLGYNAAGLIQTVTDNYGHQTILTYDAANQHLIGAQYFDGRTTTYTYNTSGSAPQIHELTGVANSCCNWRYFNYDNWGRLTGTYLGGNSEALTFSYPNSGQVNLTDALGNHTQFYYDNNGLLIKTVDGLGNAIHRLFDNNYNLISIMDPAGRSYKFEYDSDGNVISSTDPLANLTQFSITTYSRLASVTDAKGNLTNYKYDPYGNLQSTIYADGSVEDWNYDSYGNPETWNNRRGHQTFYTFNSNGQVTGKYFADGSETDYTYDTLGNLTNASTFDSELNLLESSSMSYDGSNRLVQITYPGSKYLNFTYDANGRRTSSVDQLGHQLDYYYDVAGRLESMTNELNALVVAYQYDPAGRVVTKTLANGMCTLYQYDPAGQLLTLANALANGSLLSSFNYSYDSRGRRTTMNTLDGNWTYTYDDIGQLIRAVYSAITTNVPNQDLTYIYDSVGNRTQTIENGVTNSYTVNNLNEYFSVGQTNYTFDADGNLIKESSPLGTITYSYNDENRLVSMTSPQGNWQYTYDGLGSRTVITANGTTIRDVIDPIGFGNVVGKYDSSGNLVTHYDHARELLSRTSAAGNWAGYTFDAVGNVQQVVSSNGAILNGYAFMPFGGLLRNVNAVPNPFQFNGQFGVVADDSGLNFMRNRLYSPSVGRFLSQDPIRLSGGDVNYYRYALNDSVSLNDPDALASGFDKWRSCMWHETIQAALELNLHVVIIIQKDLASLGPTVQELSSLAGTVARPEIEHLLLIVGVGAFVIESVHCIPVPDPTRPQPNQTPTTIPQPPMCYLALPMCNLVPGPNDFPRGPSDPNEMTGPAGYGANGFISSSSTLAYRIDFENVTNATAPAQQVVISDQLSTNFDWTTFNLSEFGFGNLLVSLPPGVQQFQTNVPYSYLGTNFQVQVQIGISLSSGQVFAKFNSIDPTSSLPPPVNIGFLPPEDGTGRGQGHVTYTVHAKAGVPNGTQLINVALISFDGQLSIATDQIDDSNPAAGIDPTKQALITIDSVYPTSSILPLPAQTQTLQWPVSWSGQETNGPGIASYDIHVSDNGGAWTNWLTAATSTSATFHGQPHHTYGFYCTAHDNAGNVEVAHSSADATTTVVANPLFQLTVSPTTTNLNSTATFNYTVTVKNIGSLSLSNVVMSNSIPAGVNLDYISYGRGSMTIGDSGYYWSLGNMNTNVAASMNVTADTAANGIWTNSFSVADSQGAASASAVQILYIGVLPPVLLNIALTNHQVLLSWPSSAGNFGVQQTTNLALPATWSTVSNAPTTNGSTITIPIPVTRTNQFFRLYHP